MAYLPTPAMYGHFGTWLDSGIGMTERNHQRQYTRKNEVIIERGPNLSSVFQPRHIYFARRNRFFRVAGSPVICPPLVSHKAIPL